MYLIVYAGIYSTKVGIPIHDFVIETCITIIVGMEIVFVLFGCFLRAFCFAWPPSGGGGVSFGLKGDVALAFYGGWAPSYPT